MQQARISTQPYGSITIRIQTVQTSPPTQVLDTILHCSRNPPIAAPAETAADDVPCRNGAVVSSARPNIVPKSKVADVPAACLPAQPHIACPRSPVQSTHVVQPLRVSLLIPTDSCKTFSRSAAWPEPEAGRSRAALTA